MTVKFGSWLKKSVKIFFNLKLLSFILVSGDVLKAEARIAKLNQIEILTKVRTIDVGDIQVLEALGFDDQGNSFSTLEGLRFKWELDQSDRILELIQTKVIYISFPIQFI